MTFQGDPHRTLGVSPGASLNEIKSAYRRLVKQYHPDAAGERALPRFLAIQAAYERLVDGEGRLRPPGWAPKAARGGGTRPQESWRADPNRARASRDAWRARRSGAGSASGAGAPGGAGTKPGSGAKPASGAKPGAGTADGGGTGAADGATGGDGYTWTRSSAGSHRERTHREHRRGPRKATPGSTTYDEAAEPLDPDWDGGAWYGPSSGTYWTINPREYADPRKHGPEYLARARKALRRDRRAAGDPLPADEEGDGDVRLGADAADDASADAGAPGPSPSTAASGGDPRWRWRDPAAGATGQGASTTGGGAEWGTRSWRYDGPPPADIPGERRRPAPGDPRATPRPATAQEPLPDLESIARRFAPLALLALARRSDRRWRLVLALVGWPPLGYAVGTLISTLTGCAALSPSCPEPLTMAPLVVQPLVVAGLFLVPPAAAVAAFAAVLAFAVALPVAAVLSVGSLPESRVGAPVLGVLVAVAYVAGLAWGANAVWRAPGTPDDGGGGTRGP
ncbi:MAG TPA: J domain-containing protein [Candidatus Limnocylindrales bacterium]|nr:J domain-containing protein [Candidatus Limnocylindrales bacterium]